MRPRALVVVLILSCSHPEPTPQLVPAIRGAERSIDGEHTGRGSRDQEGGVREAEVQRRGVLSTNMERIAWRTVLPHMQAISLGEPWPSL